MTMKKKEYNTPNIQVITIALPHLMAGSVQEGQNSLNNNPDDAITDGTQISAKQGGWNAWDEE